MSKVGCTPLGIKEGCQSIMYGGAIMVLRGAPVKKNNSHHAEGVVISLLWCGVSPSLHPVKSPLPEMTHPRGS